MQKMAVAAYCSEWYNLNLSEKKIFLILLAQLQTEFGNYAYGLIELNMGAFAMVHFFF